MKLLTIIFIFGTPAAFAGELNFTFTPSEGQKSFLLEISNANDQDLHCKVEISAEIGINGCEKIVDVYKYASSNLAVGGKSKIINPNFGIDRLASISLKRKMNELVFCGEPQVKTNCQ